jgi:streptomycin 6-kinase
MSDIKLPGELVKNVTGICGERGRAWLSDLPSTIHELKKQWSLKVEPPFEAGEYNFVAPAERRTGEPVVIKIAPPFETNEMIGEATFLRQRDGRGAVKLLEYDIERRAILIERAFPGKNLSELFTGNEAAAIGPAIDVLRSVMDSPAKHSELRSLDTWFDGLRRYTSVDFPADYAERALDLYGRLSNQTGRTFFLHGDYHPGNVVNATRSSYLAIDPKGIVGNIAYDIAVFLNNFHWWQEDKPDIRERLAHAVAQFSAAFEIDPIELRQWAYAQMVLSAWWSFDEMPQFYDNTVAKADIWDV